MPRIARAMAWKEWRTQRPVVLAALGLTLIMPLFLAAGLLAMQKRLDSAGLADAMPVFVIGLVWPLFAAACGATTISNEIGDKTIGFLLSRPVTRARVWSLKVGMGGLALLAVMAGSQVVMMALSLAFGGHWPTGQVLDTSIAGAAAAAVIFAAAVFFSTFIGRAMTAAAAGLVTALGLGAGVVVIWSRLDLQPRLEPALLGAEAALAAALFLLGSFYVFARGEMLRGAAALRTASIGLLVIVAGLLLVGVPLIYAQMRLGPGTAVLADLVPAPDGSAVAVTASTPQGNSPQVWLVHTSGSGFERLTGRLSYAPAFSPDGRYVAYLSSRGVLGFRSEHQALHVVGTDGAEDRLLLDGLEEDLSATQPRMGDPAILFSPDGRTVALKTGDKLYAVPAGGGPPVVFDIGGTSLARGRLAGWSTDSSEIILVAPATQDGDGTSVSAFSPRGTARRTVYESDADYPFLSVGPTPPGGIDRLPLLVRPRGSEDILRRRLLLLDLDEDGVVTISENACFPNLTLSADAKTVVYVDVFGDRTSGRRREMHRLDLTTMEDRPMATLETGAWQMLISPSADRVAVQRLAKGPSIPSGVILDLQGRATELPAGWSIPIGWSGRNRVIVAQDDRTGASRRLALADAATGELNEIYPGNGIIRPEGEQTDR